MIVTVTPLAPIRTVFLPPWLLSVQHTQAYSLLRIASSMYLTHNAHELDRQGHHAGVSV